jgi:hypothetical protein
MGYIHILGLHVTVIGDFDQPQFDTSGKSMKLISWQFLFEDQIHLPANFFLNY